jgi:lysophospholipase L1-like esterase
LCPGAGSGSPKRTFRAHGARDAEATALTRLPTVAPTAGPHFVALGSSFAAGPGIAPVVDRAARRSGLNYAHQVARTLGLALTDVSFSGATTAQVLDARRRTLRAAVPPQLEAVGPETRLVTITVGGNDLGYIGGLISASISAALARRAARLSPALAGHLRRPSLLVDADRVRAATDGMTRVGEAVRRRAPQARILFVDYLTVIGSHELPAGPAAELPLPAAAPPPADRSAAAELPRRLPLTLQERRQAATTAAALAEAFAVAAERSGAELVRASAASLDHGPLSPQPWVTGFGGGFLVPGATVPYHPTLAGMTAVAELVVEHLRRS